MFISFSITNHDDNRKVTAGHSDKLDCAAVLHILSQLRFGFALGSTDSETTPATGTSPHVILRPAATRWAGDFLVVATARSELHEAKHSAISSQAARSIIR